MTTTKTVGVKDLKNNLSAYLREVRRGARVLVTDRNSVVAELRGPVAGALDDVRPPVVAEWIDAAVLTPPSRLKAPLPRSPVRLPSGTARAILDELRGEAGS
jgi:antitoxin (DNA-binding transcriptional repressor) of toxin-antitoxin stability system